MININQKKKSSMKFKKFKIKFIKIKNNKIKFYKIKRNKLKDKNQYKAKIHRKNLERVIKKFKIQKMNSYQIYKIC